MLGGIVVFGRNGRVIEFDLMGIRLFGVVMRFIVDYGWNCVSFEFVRVNFKILVVIVK